MVKQSRNKKRKIKKTFTRKSKHFFRMKGGDILDCDKEGFTYEMRLAGLGNGYSVNAHSLHVDGEQWHHNKLITFSMNGIVKWWIDHLKFTEQNPNGIQFTEVDLKKIKANKDLYLLGAFFHRYKILIEIFQDLTLTLNGGVKQFSIFNKANNDEWIGRNSFKRYANFDNISNPSKHVAKIIATKISNLIEQFEENIDFPIQSALDKAQCIMFYIVKNKGENPPGFIMDPRIKKRALTPILINSGIKQNSSSNARKFTTTTIVEWLDFFINENKELSTPPVTFGVFE